MSEPVQGYLFVSGGEALSDRNDTVCQIVARTEGEELEAGPMFVVVFGDGVRINAYSYELSPWYPT